MSPNELREWRAARGLTQKQLAELAGVTIRQVRRWESGVTPIPRLLELYTQEH